MECMCGGNRVAYRGATGLPWPGLCLSVATLALSLASCGNENRLLTVTCGPPPGDSICVYTGRSDCLVLALASGSFQSYASPLSRPAALGKRVALVPAICECHSCRAHLHRQT